MTRDKSYSPGDRMMDLIADDYRLIQVLTRFGIRMGFGERTVAEVCREAGVDCATFLSVVNFVMEGYSAIDETDTLSVSSLLHYLRQSHIYFLDYCLPDIERKLREGLGHNPTPIGDLMLRFLREYAEEVRRHMEYEEQNLFVYVNALLRGRVLSGFDLATYSSSHEQVAYKLTELKKLIIRYCPPEADPNLLNAALYDIYRCEQELASHCCVEDHIFTPAIQALERKTKA